MRGVDDDDALAAREPARDDPVAAFHLRGLDRHVAYLAVLADDLDGRAVGRAQQRVARHEDRVARDRAIERDPHVRAGQQFALRVRKERTHRHRVGGRVDGKIREQQLALARVRAAVRAHERHLDVLLRDARRASALHRAPQRFDVGRGLREVHVDRIELLDGRERRRLILADERAFGHERAARAAVDRRGDGRVIELQLRARELRARRRDGRLRLPFVGERLGVVALADRAVAHELVVAAALVERREVRGPRLLERARGRVARRLERRGIDPEQHRAALDFLPFLVGARGHDARDPRAHLGLPVRVEPARQFDRQRHRCLLHRDDARLARRGGVVLAFVLAAAGRDERRDRERRRQAARACPFVFHFSLASRSTGTNLGSVGAIDYNQSRLIK
ncbi:efflux transporter, RND family, MFP subunit domain protein [Burkholderia pseudomallei MSHR2990]|nr:efflux transporter, RND family, MFP subunit domain protein [Burkholderia pseudomallei MSHR2990]